MKVAVIVIAVGPMVGSVQSTISCSDLYKDISAQVHAENISAQVAIFCNYYDTGQNNSLQKYRQKETS